MEASLTMFRAINGSIDSNTGRPLEGGTRPCHHSQNERGQVPPPIDRRTSPKRKRGNSSISTRLKNSLACGSGLFIIFFATFARADSSLDKIRPFLKKHCHKCHGAEKQKGDHRFDTLKTDLTHVETLEIWQGIVDQLNLGEMPPKKQQQPTITETQPVIDTITASLKMAYGKHRSKGGQAVIRRLNRHELRNTLRDLLHLNGSAYRPGAANSRLVDNNGNGSIERTGDDPLRFFPEDENKDGFVNIGDTLVMSDFLLKLMLGAAEETIQAATHLGPKPDTSPRRFAGHINKRGTGDMEMFARQLYPKFDAMYRTGVLSADQLGRGVGVSARYRVTVEVSGHNQKHPWTETIPTKHDEPFLLTLEMRKGRDGVPLAHWELPGDGTTRRFTTEAWIDHNWIPQLSWENGPTTREARVDLLMKKFMADQWRDAPNRKVITDKKQYDQARKDWQRDMAVTLLKNYHGPSVRVHSMTIQPIIDQWPPKSHTSLYGSKPVTSLKRGDIEKMIIAFADRAFRRPVTTAEVAPYVDLVMRQKGPPPPPGSKETNPSTNKNIDALPPSGAPGASGGSNKVGGRIGTLTYRVYKGKFHKLPDFTQLKPIANGVLKSGWLDIKPAKMTSDFGMVFDGTLKTHHAGDYYFEIASDDGSRILINGKQVVINDGLHGANIKKSGKVRLPAGSHRIRVEYFQQGGGLGLHAFWQGPGFARTSLTGRTVIKPRPQPKPPGANNKQKQLDLASAEGRAIRALQDGYIAILCSPQFVYMNSTATVRERPLHSPSRKPLPHGRGTDHDTSGGDALDNFGIASRLSYFLWSSMPDETLFKLARAGKLTDPKVRDEQVERMLRDPKAKAFVRHFPSAWLRLDKLGKMPPSGNEYAFYRNLRVEPMLHDQVTLYFSELLATNGKIEQFIDSDYTYMNSVLAKWVYRREGYVRSERMQKVNLDTPAQIPTGSKDQALRPRYGGIFTLPGVMTATANGVDTSPVIRGVWVLENVLGTPPAPPPPDVEPLPTDTREATTIREQLALHRQHEACNSCHRKIDPMGFAFENFDPVGRWRDRYKRAKGPIDTSTELSTGEKIADIVEFKKMLMSRKQQVIRCLTEKMLTYASGRLLEPTDRGEVDAIVSQLNSKGNRLRDLVRMVVQSDVFLRK